MHHGLKVDNIAGEKVMECCEPLGMWCCCCGINCSPGSMGGYIKSKKIGDHFYCYGCYPKMVDVYLAEKKLMKYSPEAKD